MGIILDDKLEDCTGTTLRKQLEDYEKHCLTEIDTSNINIDLSQSIDLIYFINAIKTSIRDAFPERMIKIPCRFIHVYCEECDNPNLRFSLDPIFVNCKFLGEGLPTVSCEYNFKSHKVEIYIENELGSKGMPFVNKIADALSNLNKNNKESK